jgi:hypothetical protein
MEQAALDRRLAGFSDEMRAIITAGIQRVARNKTRIRAEQIEREMRTTGASSSPQVRQTGSKVQHPIETRSRRTTMPRLSTLSEINRRCDQIADEMREMKRKERRVERRANVSAADRAMSRKYTRLTGTDFDGTFSSTVGVSMLTLNGER